jgi:hypothetical protein
VLKFRIKAGLAIVSRDRCRKGQNIWEIDFQNIFQEKREIFVKSRRAELIETAGSRRDT